MIKYLNRLKNKKGFSLIELVVVIAIIAVLLTALLVNMIGGNTDKILSANTNAKSFLTAAQLTFTRAQLTERSLVNYPDTEEKFIEYKAGSNIIKDGKYLFVEAKFEQNGIVGLHIDYTFNGLMNKPDITASGPFTTLENYLAKNIDEYLTESYDGYFYAAIDNNFKVIFTHFCDYRLPTYGGDLVDFRDSMRTHDNKVVGNDCIIGSCSDTYLMPSNRDYVFALPDPTESDYGKYLA